MKFVLVLAFSFCLSGCLSAPSSSLKTSEDQLQPIHILDSLKGGGGLGSLVVRSYQGELSVDSLTKEPCTITLYNYQHSGDGVYTIVQNGQDEGISGRLYTLRGDARDDNATVYQLVPFRDGKKWFNFRYTDTGLEQLNQNFESTGLFFTLIPNDQFNTK